MYLTRLLLIKYFIFSYVLVWTIVTPAVLLVPMVMMFSVYAAGARRIPGEGV